MAKNKNRRNRRRQNSLKRGATVTTTDAAEARSTVDDTGTRCAVESSTILSDGKVVAIDKATGGSSTAAVVDTASSPAVGKRKAADDSGEIHIDPDGKPTPLKRSKKCKRRRKERKVQGSETGGDTVQQYTQPEFPFPTDPDDHCESPLEAYSSIEPLLNKLAKTTGSIALAIYDPYYCDGAVVRNLGEIGFPNVYNRKEDCYKMWADNATPHFDVLVTNPPYSEDHIEKLIGFVTSQQYGDRPWFLLLPQFVHKKDFYKAATSKIRPFYLVPSKRYVYVPPKSFRKAKKSDVHKKSSPFVSMWYCWGGSPPKNEQLIQQFHDNSKGDCELARSKSALRDLRRRKR